MRTIFSESEEDDENIYPLCSDELKCSQAWSPPSPRPKSASIPQSRLAFPANLCDADTDSSGGACLRNVVSEQLDVAERALAQKHREVLNFVVQRLQLFNLTEIEATELRAENATLRTRLGETVEFQTALDYPLPPMTDVRAPPPAEVPPKMISPRSQERGHARLDYIPGMIDDERRVTFTPEAHEQAPRDSVEQRSDSPPQAPNGGTCSVSTLVGISSALTSPHTKKSRSSLTSSKGFSTPDQEDPRSSVHRHFRFAVLSVWTEENSKSVGDFNPSLAKDMMKQLKNGSTTRDDYSAYGKTCESSNNPEILTENDLYNKDSLCKVSNSRYAQYVIHPYSPRRGAWDLLSLFLVVYDTIMIPLSFFDIPENTFVTFGDWVTRLFWSADIVMSFTTGFVTVEGIIEMRPQKIFRRYMRTWFGLDALIVGVDWLEVILATSGGALGFARLSKSSRIFRIVRMVRLLRVMRMKEVLAFITERINSEKVLILAHIMKLLAVVFVVSHLIACLWYGVGYRDPDTMENWVNFYGFAGKPLSARYTMSLHWATAQLAGGMDEVTPENPIERIYAIFVFILAFIVAAYFVSSLTSSMTQLQILGSGQLQMMSILRQFLAQNKIPSNLSMRIQRNATHTYKEQQRKTPEEDVSMLGFVSEPLRMELHFYMCRPLLNGHPFFRAYMEEYPQVMRKVCHKATAHIRYCGGDVIFHAGELPAQPKMYFLVDGTLSYVFVNKEKVKVHAGEWISEAVLWTHWMCRGDLSAHSNAHLVTLDAKEFQDIVSGFSHHASYVDPRAYAKEFVKRLNRNALGISDLPTRNEDTVMRHATVWNVEDDKSSRTLGYSWSFGSARTSQISAAARSSSGSNPK